MSRNKVLSIVDPRALMVFALRARFTTPALAAGSTPSAPTRTAPSSSNQLSQLPSGTKVVIVDNQGSVVPLGSQAAQDIVASGDPIWCPSTVTTPIAGLSGCSPAFINTNLYTLTHAVMFGLWMPTVTNSTIWILGGADSSGSQASLNGTSLPLPIWSLLNFTLTLKGGWTGVGSTINPAAPSTLSAGGGISIANWSNSVTISNVVVNNATGNGIYIQTYSKNITLTNVQSNYGQFYGAYLDTSSGAGSVIITNSSFNYNSQASSTGGLKILSA